MAAIFRRVCRKVKSIKASLKEQTQPSITVNSCPGSGYERGKNSPVSQTLLQWLQEQGQDLHSDPVSVGLGIFLSLFLVQN